MQQTDLLNKPFDELTADEWEQVRLTASCYEVDSIPDVFGAMYRVWTHGGMRLAGTFYECRNGGWKAQQINSDYAIDCKSDGEAIAVILG